MTDYAKHIETLACLQSAQPGRPEYWKEALTAAIELMRAAVPKDAEAERRHCVVIARTIDGRGDTVRTVYSQRAAAHAEGYAQGAIAVETSKGYVRLDLLQGQLSAAQAEIAELKRAATPKSPEEETRVCETICLPLAAAKWLESVDAVRAGRAAARAEGYAQAVAEKTVFAAQMHVQCMNELSAAQAEIERLRAENEMINSLANRYGVDVDSLQTKLNNLRVAAERVLRRLNYAQEGAERVILEDAIEASR